MSAIETFAFLKYSIALALFIAVAGVLWRAIIWTPRGITAANTRQQLWAGVTGLLPQSKTGKTIAAVLGFAVAAPMLWVLIKWLLAPAEGGAPTPTLSIMPSFAAMLDSFAYVLIAGVAALVVAIFLPKDAASKVKATAWSVMTGYVALTLIVGFADWKGDRGVFVETANPCEKASFSRQGKTVCTLTEGGARLTTTDSILPGEVVRFCADAGSAKSLLESKQVGPNTFKLWAKKGAFPVALWIENGAKCTAALTAFK